MEENKECVCNSCNYRWVSKVADPKQCPNCKRYDWKKVKEEKI